LPDTVHDTGWQVAKEERAMRRGLVGLGVGIALFAMAGQVASAAESLGLITGSDKGTYYQFGLNLQALVKPQGIDLTVYPSRGSVENVYAVFQRPGVQMGSSRPTSSPSSAGFRRIRS